MTYGKVSLISSHSCLIAYNIHGWNEIIKPVHITYDLWLIKLKERE